MFGGRHCHPLHFSCLENPINKEAWSAIDHRVTKSWTQLEWLSMHAFIFYINSSIVWLLHNFYLFVLVMFKHQNAGLIKWDWAYSLSLSSFCKNLKLFFSLNVWWNYSIKLFGSDVFFVGKFLLTLNHLICISWYFLRH